MPASTMSYIAWTTLAIGIAMLSAAKWAVIRMTQEINRRREPREWISLAWWPTYKDRLVMRTYHSVLPQGRWNVAYVSCISSGVALLVLSVIFASHSQI
jgi:hypothetical protein